MRNLFSGAWSLSLLWLSPQEHYFSEQLLPVHHEALLITCGYTKLFAGIKQIDERNRLTTVFLAPGRDLLPIV